MCRRRIVRCRRSKWPVAAVLRLATISVADIPPMPWPTVARPAHRIHARRLARRPRSVHAADLSLPTRHCNGRNRAPHWTAPADCVDWRFVQRAHGCDGHAIIACYAAALALTGGSTRGLLAHATDRARGRSGPMLRKGHLCVHAKRLSPPEPVPIAPSLIAASVVCARFAVDMRCWAVAEHAWQSVQCERRTATGYQRPRPPKRGPPTPRGWDLGQQRSRWCAFRAHRIRRCFHAVLSWKPCMEEGSLDRRGYGDPRHAAPARLGRHASPSGSFERPCMVLRWGVASLHTPALPVLPPFLVPRTNPLRCCPQTVPRRAF